jgi:hypothetical protein
VTRTCARPGCREAAVATLSYAYGDRAVWVEPLVADSHPMTHDLCAEHAATVRVPNGWTCRDLRADGPPGENAGAELAEPGLADPELAEGPDDGRLFADRISA